MYTIRHKDTGKIIFEGNDMKGADLKGAYLTGADLSGANLRGADLRRANLFEANLSKANLEAADIEGANLKGADLRGANFRKVIIAKQPTQLIVPSEGDIIGYKKLDNGIIAKLLIPKEAKRVSSTSRKCRAEYAKVIALSEGTKGYSKHDDTFEYAVGEIVRPKAPFDDDWREECASGIHFFITKQEAEEYNT